MGTIASPWHYDAVACHAIRPDNQRRTAILRYASWALFLPISPGGPPSMAAFLINPEIDAMCQQQTCQACRMS
jgi:hypothetical protein